ncbi:MAG: hypothetical protein PVG88_02860, partial [Methyloceanibacter sp.]
YSSTASAVIAHESCWKGTVFRLTSPTENLFAMPPGVRRKILFIGLKRNNIALNAQHGHFS